jgi:uncharacterized protein (TIGR03067 family)
MRTHAFLGIVAGVILTVQVGILRSAPLRETETARIARLITQLGDDSFDKREAASRELEAIGEPALAPLRKTAATSKDPEIRRRSESIAKNIAARLFAPIAKKELEALQGTWYSTSTEYSGMRQTGEEKAARHIITSDRWENKDGDTVLQSGILNVIEVSDKLVKMDFIVTAGFGKGDTWLAIYERKGDELKWCGGYGGLQGLARPTTLTTKAGDGGYFVRSLKREKK